MGHIHVGSHLIGPCRFSSLRLATPRRRGRPQTGFARTGWRGCFLLQFPAAACPTCRNFHGPALPSSFGRSVDRTGLQGGRAGGWAQGGSLARPVDGPRRLQLPRGWCDRFRADSAKGGSRPGRAGEGAAAGSMGRGRAPEGPRGRARGGRPRGARPLPAVCPPGSGPGAGMVYRLATSCGEPFLSPFAVRWRLPCGPRVWKRPGLQAGDPPQWGPTAVGPRGSHGSVQVVVTLWRLQT